MNNSDNKTMVNDFNVLSAEKQEDRLAQVQAQEITAGAWERVEQYRRETQTGQFVVSSEVWRNVQGW